MEEEELKAQIEQLRAIRGRNRQEETEDREDTEDFRAYRKRYSTNEKEEKEKKDDGIFGVLTVQSILVVILAIIYVLLVTFAPKTAGDTFLSIKEKTAKDFSFQAQVYQAVNSVITYLNQIEPLTQETEGVSSEDMAGAEDVLEKDVPVTDSPSSGVSEESSGETSSTEDANENEGMGGEYQPADGISLPEGVSFAPVVYTGSITFPIEYPGRITSGFGFRDHPINGRQEFHNALDIAAAKGTNVLAAADGVIILSEESGGLGRHIVVDHGNGFLTTYGHCETLIGKVGTRIREGEVIAKVGSTGDSTGYHLHFALRKDGIYVDPTQIFPEYIDAAV